MVPWWVVATVFLVAKKSWMFEPLAFDEYCRFDTRFIR
jgi:hypothetical protein